MIQKAVFKGFKTLSDNEQNNSTENDKYILGTNACGKSNTMERFLFQIKADDK